MNRFLTTAFLASLVSATQAESQTTQRVTDADYDRAARFLAQNMAGLVVGGSVAPTWLPDGRFWYRNATLSGSEIVVIDPQGHKRDVCPAPASSCAGAS